MLHELEAQLKVRSFQPIIINHIIAWSVPDENARVCEYLESMYQHYDRLRTQSLIDVLERADAMGLNARWSAMFGPVPDVQSDLIFARTGHASVVRVGPATLSATWLGSVGHTAMILLDTWHARDSRRTDTDTYAILVGSEPVPAMLLESRSATAPSPQPEIVPEPPRLVMSTATRSSSSIIFRINNRAVGATVLFGPQPSVSFFDDLKGQLQGECTVTFRVGNQLVENRVILNGRDLRVNNTFEAIDIQPFIANQRHRVEREMEEAHFEDQPTDVYFLSARTLLAQDRVFPEFNRATLAKDPTGDKYFVSHRWLSPEHPDPDGRHLHLLQKHASEHPDAFYWIDYSCLPQSRHTDDENLFKRTLPKIASIQAKASTIVILTLDYEERLWCHVEHLTAVFIEQASLAAGTVEYLGPVEPEDHIIERVQTLQEPAWDKLKVTKAQDIPWVKYNYRWLANLVKYRLYDGFSELRNSLPGNDLYSGLHYPQSAFGINHGDSLHAIRSVFEQCGGDTDRLFEKHSMLWLARRYSWSAFPDHYPMDALRFSPSLLFSEDMVGWLALLLGIIKLMNRGNVKIVHMRELYAKIVLMSLFK